jgi:hypothetical protein
MLSIIIEKENFEVNCLYKTRWDSYPGIGEEKKIIFIKKTDPTFYTPFLLHMIVYLYFKDKKKLKIVKKIMFFF